MKNSRVKKKPENSQFVDDKSFELLQNRDREFLSALFIEVNPYLARVCMANGIYNENADEVIQNTWDKFFSNLQKFEGRSEIKTFICGILFNKIREYRRSQGKAVYEDDSEKVMEHAFTSEGWWAMEQHSPYKIMEMQQAGQFIRECMEGLSEQQKAAFVMREVEEENSDEICHVLGVNVTHLRVLLFRAKDKLRKCLEGRVTMGNT